MIIDYGIDQFWDVGWVISSICIQKNDNISLSFFNTLGGDEVCFVTMKGAKSGRTLTIPLMYVPYRDGVLLVASQGGAPKNPVWYHNLVKHPDIEVRHRGERMELRARLASPDEKPELWPLCDEHYAPYAQYRERTTRDIPIFVCEPAPS